MPEKALPIQAIFDSDILVLAWDTTLAVFIIGLLLGGVAQISHLYRYLYEPFGFIGKLILWQIPTAGFSAWAIAQRPPYPEYAPACFLVIPPVLCMLSSCLYLARALLPELGDFRKIMDIIAANREKTWSNIAQNIWRWFEATKKKMR